MLRVSCIAFISGRKRIGAKWNKITFSTIIPIWFLKDWTYFCSSFLVRIDESEKEVPDIGAFTGFMSSISPIESKSKPYYHVSLPKSPSKSVVYTLMKKAADAASNKRMPFIQFVGCLLYTSDAADE